MKRHFLGTLSLVAALGGCGKTPERSTAAAQAISDRQLVAIANLNERFGAEITSLIDSHCPQALSDPCEKEARKLWTTICTDLPFALSTTTTCENRKTKAYNAYLEAHERCMEARAQCLEAAANAE